MSISTIFTLAGWALLIGLGLYVFYVVSMRSQRRDTKISVLVVAVLLIGSLALLTLGAGLVFIDQFESGVVVSPLSAGGVRPDPIGPGIHFVTPFIESVDRFTTAKQEYTMSGTTNEGACRAMTRSRRAPPTASKCISMRPCVIMLIRPRWLIYAGPGRVKTAIFKALCGLPPAM